MKFTNDSLVERATPCRYADMVAARDGKVDIVGLTIVVMDMCMIARDRRHDRSTRAWALVVADDALAAYPIHHRTVLLLRKQVSGALEFMQAQ